MIAAQKKTLRERLEEWAAHWKREVRCRRHGLCDCYRRGIEILDRDTQRIARSPTQFHLDAVNVQKTLDRARTAVSSLVERTKPDGFMIVMYGSNKIPRRAAKKRNARAKQPGTGRFTAARQIAPK